MPLEGGCWLRQGKLFALWSLVAQLAGLLYVVSRNVGSVWVSWMVQKRVANRVRFPASAPAGSLV